MKRALRKTDTTMFIKSDGGETSSIAMARCFASYDEAIAFCRANRLTGVELVAQTDDKSEMTVAVPESSPDAINVCSTPDSAARGEIARLAILETLGAVSVSLLLINVFGSGVHIVAGALIAPLLFLRTEASTATAFRLFDAWAGRLDLANRKLRWLPLVAFLAVLAKIFATIATLISSPRETLGAIPGNWLRIALATDHKHPPELLPGTETDSEAPASVQRFRYDELRSQIASGVESSSWRTFALWAIYAPAVLYRLFLKSTSLVYFPLIWVSDVPMTVRGIVISPLEQVRRWYATAIVLLMLIPLFVPLEPSSTFLSAQDRAIFTYVLPIAKMDWWDITRALGVGVTFALYLYAKKLDDELQHAETERRIITWAHHVRGACGIFTMVCFLVIVLAL